MMPKHLLFIPDGNRRFLKNSKSNLVYFDSEILEIGFNKIYEITKFLIKELGFEGEISFVVLTPDNLKRENLMECVNLYSEKISNKLKEQQNLDNFYVETKVFGDLSPFSLKTQKILSNILESNQPASGKKSKLNLFINYDMEKDFCDYKSYKDWKENSEVGRLPLFDMVIRTGGNKRISGFAPMKFGYAEIYFLDCLWPEIDGSILHKYLQDYNSRMCNYGL